MVVVNPLAATLKKDSNSPFKTKEIIPSEDEKPMIGIILQLNTPDTWNILDTCQYLSIRENHERRIKLMADLTSC